MKPERPEKKSETIKVRVPFSLKRQFLARARREGRSASELFRDFMEDYVRRPAQRPSTQTLETVMHKVRKHPRPAFAAIAGAAGISALLAGVIPAGAAPDLRPAFATMDLNGDGVVSAAEYRQSTFVVEADSAYADNASSDAPNGAPAWVIFAGGASIRTVPADPANAAAQPDIAQFLRFDTDRDGSVSLAEWEAGFEQSADQVFARLDGDGDGVLTGTEQRSVTALDADGDGRISRREFSAALVFIHV